MSLLAGHRVAALGGMADRPLARFLASLGAEIGGPVEGASFVIDDLGLAATRGFPIPPAAVPVLADANCLRVRLALTTSTAGCGDAQS